MKRPLMAHAAACLAALAMVLAPVAPAHALAPTTSAVQVPAVSSTGPITLTGFQTGYSVTKPGDRLNMSWASSGIPVRRVGFTWDGPGGTTQGAQWFGHYDPTGSHAGNATASSMTAYDLPGLYRLSSINLEAPSGTVTYFPDGAIARDGKVFAGERHNFDFRAASFNFKNPEMPASSFAAAPAPRITGTAAVGSVLRASAEGWSPTPAFLKYQWHRDGQPIYEVRPSGYGRAAEPSYTLSPADAGHKITVTVEGWAHSRKQTIATSAPTGAIKEQVRAGTVTVAGKSVFGSTLRAIPAGWGKDVKLSYQWYTRSGWRPATLEGQPIVGATSPTYTAGLITLGDFAGLLVKITGSKPGLAPVTVSTGWQEVRDGTLTAVPPTFSGTLQVGKTLTANHGLKTPATEILYGWYRNDKFINDAFYRTYVLSPADRGARISVKIIASERGYEEYRASSTHSKPVDHGKFNAPSLKVAGTAQVGKQLTATRAAFKPKAAVKYVWLRNGKAISKATSKTYKLTAADRGKKVSARAHATAPGYTPLSATSAPTKAVAYGTLAAPSVKVKGTARVGSKLTATHLAFKPKAAMKYVWLRNGKAISKATGKTYKVTAADRGKKVGVRITGSLAGYKAFTRTAASVSIR